MVDVGARTLHAPSKLLMGRHIGDVCNQVVNLKASSLVYILSLLLLLVCWGAVSKVQVMMSFLAVRTGSGTPGLESRGQTSSA